MLSVVQVVTFNLQVSYSQCIPIRMSGTVRAAEKITKIVNLTEYFLIKSINNKNNNTFRFH